MSKKTILYVAIGLLVSVYALKFIQVDQLFQFQYKVNSATKTRLVCAETMSKGIRIMQIWLDEQRREHPNDTYAFVLDSGVKKGFC